MGALLAQEVGTPWWKWVLLSAVITVMVTATTVGGIIGLAWHGVDFLDYVYLARPPYIDTTTVAAWMAFLVAGQTLGPALVMLCFRHTRTLAMAGLCRPGDGVGALWRLLGGIGLLLALQAAWSATTLVPAEHWRVVEHLVYAVQGGRGGVWPSAILAWAVGVVGPLAEELLFRGVLYGVLRRRWGFWAGAIGSSLMFGLSHGPVNALPTAVFGFFLAWQAERDGSLAGPVALHVLNNLGALVVISATL